MKRILPQAAPDPAAAAETRKAERNIAVLLERRFVEIIACSLKDISELVAGVKRDLDGIHQVYAVDGAPSDSDRLLLLPQYFECGSFGEIETGINQDR